MYILCAENAHEKRLEMAENQAKLVSLDKMSRRNEGGQGKNSKKGHGKQAGMNRRMQD